jgi:SPP1 family holin
MKIDKFTIIRTFILVLALINQVMAAAGHSIINIDDETVTNLVSTVFTVITAVIAWWKNNSFTKPALQADQTLAELKEEAKNAKL